MKPLFLHHHIFKNAGTTIDEILKRELGSEWVNIEPDAQTSRVGPELIETALRSNPGIRGISSHHLGFEKLNRPDRWLIDIVTLRHPLDRLASIYRHYRRVGEGSEFFAIAQRESLGGFCIELARQFPCMVFNSQCVVLGNEGFWYYPPNDEVYDRASSVMHSAPVLLSVESLSRGLAVAESFLRQILPDLNLAFVPMNVTKRPSLDYDVVLAEVKEEMGNSIWDYFLERNQFDLRLWELARLEVSRRSKYVLDFDALRRDFDARCAAIRPRESVTDGN